MLSIFIIICLLNCSDRVAPVLILPDIMPIANTFAYPAKSMNFQKKKKKFHSTIFTLMW